MAAHVGTPQARSSAWQAAQPPRFWNRHFAALAALAFLILFVNLNRGDLSGYDDAFHADQGRQILRTGDWWTLRHNGGYNPQFPPLFYWMEAVSMKTWGVNDFAAKFPSALLGWFTILATYCIAWELTGDTWFSLLAMIVLTSTQFFIKYSGHAMTDVPFAFFLTLALLSYIKGFAKPWFFAWSGCAVGLAMLTRPVVGLLAPGIFLAHLMLTRRFDLLRSKYVLAGLAAAGGLPASWYAVQYGLHGPAALGGAAALMVQQLTSGRPPNWVRIVSGAGFYPKMLAERYWPWLPFLLIGLWEEGRKAWRGQDFAAMLLLLWIAGFVAPFSLGDAKQFRYILPVFPAMAIVAAMPLARWIRPRLQEACLRGVCLVGAAAVAFLFLFPGTMLRATDMTKLAPIARAHARPEQRLILYTHGEYEWGYQNQLLWYSDRYTDFLTSLPEVREHAAADPTAPIIMDKDSFARFAALLEQPSRIEVLGQSKLFFCFRVMPKT